MAEGRGWLKKFWTPHSKRAERRSVDHFAAYRWDGSALRHDRVRDIISASGVYILTKGALAARRSGFADAAEGRPTATKS